MTNGLTKSEIENMRRVEKSVRKLVTASVELDASKGCSIRCMRQDLYYAASASNGNRDKIPVLSMPLAGVPVPPPKACSPRPKWQLPTRHQPKHNFTHTPNNFLHG